MVVSAYNVHTYVLYICMVVTTMYVCTVHMYGCECVQCTYVYTVHLYGCDYNIHTDIRMYCTFVNLSISLVKMKEWTMSGEIFSVRHYFTFICDS